jgi:CRISPR-associated protein Csb2
LPTLRFRFPGGRYHATPWGHHVNEGLIEWPPSPWRLLRALVASGFSSQGWGEIPPLAQSLVEKLSETLPLYNLPEVSVGHSRHFMPIGVIDKGREKTTLVFDTWAHVGDGELFVHWPCELSTDELRLLGQLAAGLGYLGRSESWVECEVVADAEGPFNAFPYRDGDALERGREQISTMSAVPAAQYRDGFRQREEEIAERFPVPEGKKKAPQGVLKNREKALAPFPPDLLSCLTKDTMWWKGHGWSQPPGSQRVLYWRRADSLQVGTPVQSIRQSEAPVSMMLLSLTTPSGNRAALEPITRALPQAELFHRTIIRCLGKGDQVDCPELTGKDGDGNPLREHHRHAYTVSLDLDGDGHLDHVLVFAEMKLGAEAQRAIREVRETWRKKGPDLQVSVVGSGDLELLRKIPGRAKRGIESLLGSPEGTRIWKSVTPFVPPRYLKERGKNTLLGQVNAELESRRLPPAESVEVSPDLTRAMRHFIRRRGHGRAPQPPMDVGLGLRITFSEPVKGPLLLGYASHFGLGLFAPADP